MKQPIVFITFLILFISSCKKEETVPGVSLQKDILQGFECRNDMADKYYIIGNPDIKLCDVGSLASQNYNFSILSFPTPNISYNNYYYSNQINYSSAVNFFINAYKPMQHARLRIEKAYYNSAPSSTEIALGAVTYVSNPYILDMDSLNLHLGENLLAFNVSSVEPGYYRVYLQIDDVLLWDNLIINTYPF